MTQDTRPLGLKAPNRGVGPSGRCIRIGPNITSARIQTHPSSAYIKAAFKEKRSSKSDVRTAWRWASSLSHLLSSWGNPTVKTRTQITPHCWLAIRGANWHLSEVVEFPRLLSWPGLPDGPRPPACRSSVKTVASRRLAACNGGLLLVLWG